LFPARLHNVPDAVEDVSRALARVAAMSKGDGRAMQFPFAFQGSEAVRWLLHNNFYYRKSPGDDKEAASRRYREVVSHVCMVGYNGGNLAVPLAELPTFHRLLALDHEQGCAFFFCENALPVAPLFIDLDLKGAAQYDADHLPQFIAALREVCAKFFTPEALAGDRRLLDVACTATDLAEVLRRGDGFGAHLVMPKVLVSVAQMRSMRALLVSVLSERYGARPPGCNAWADVVDDKIYAGVPGLRMPLAHKAAPCPNKCKRSATCDKCLGAGRVYIGRVYKFHSYVSDDAEISERYRVRLRDDGTALLNVMTLRPPSQPAATAGWVRPLGAPATQESGETVKGVPGTSAEAVAVTRFVREAAKRSLLPQIYKGVDVVKVTHRKGTKKSGPLIYCTAGGKGSSYCANIGRDHRSHGIYFEVSREGLQVRCYCRCSDTKDRRTGKVCADYRSETIRLDAGLRKALFPEESRARVGGGGGSPAAGSAAAAADPAAGGIMQEPRALTEASATEATKRLAERGGIKRPRGAGSMPWNNPKRARVEARHASPDLQG
jgi:hypothetical protein